MNRPGTISYSGATPSKVYAYDADYKGELSSSTVTSGTLVYKNSFVRDPLGRITGSTQLTAGTPYSFQYQYSVGDRLEQVNYPSGRSVKYGADSVGRVANVQNGATAVNYAALGYDGSGQVSSIAMRNGIVETYTRNDRAQLTGMTAVAGSTTTQLSLGLYPCPGGAVTSCTAGNNGLVRAQVIGAPGFNVTQSYTYDSGSRLTGTAEGTAWSEAYKYVDSAGALTGNRWVDTTGRSGLPGLTSQTPQAPGWYLARNQISGWTHDGAGNLTVAGGGLQRTFGYDAFGNLAAEYAVNTPPSACGTATCFLTVDHLGSTRMVTDDAGAVKARYDYLPFGEELLAGTGGRTGSLGYAGSADGFRLKYTGQARDAETGLDYMHLRYYDPVQGRFQGADPANAGADAGSPQTWNGYAYVNNNPLNYTDPSGLFVAEATAVGGTVGGPVGAGIGAVWIYAS